MIQDKKIFYWSPYFANIATPKAVINSAYSLLKYSNNYNCSVINFFGEFDNYENKSNFQNINFISYFHKNLIKILPKKGKILSRTSFLIIFFLSFFPLKNLIQKKKPDFLIIHLITSLPLILLILFRFKTKFILRISGTPKLGFFRKFLWRVALKKIYIITCPTVSSLEYLVKLKIVEEKKIHLLFDPILEVRKSSFYMKKNFFIPGCGNYFCAAGRLTKQKNFLFLCRVFNLLFKRHSNLKLVIAGEGENKNQILSYINKNKLNDKIYLVGHIENIYSFFYNSRGFILPSLWEDPGFVLIEAAFCRTPIISSNFNNRSNKIIVDNHNGFVFENNNELSLFNVMENFLSKDKVSKKITLQALKMTRQYSLFFHYARLNKLLN